jgi:hypothetical protein
MIATFNWPHCVLLDLFSLSFSLPIANYPFYCGATGLHLPAASSALDLLAVQQPGQQIVTFCAELDRILGGGISCGQVTEFCGVPGVGKTQIGWVCLTVSKLSILQSACLVLYPRN